jgi:hypothetical protein
MEKKSLGGKLLQELFSLRLSSLLNKRLFAINLPHETFPARQKLFFAIKMLIHHS